MKRRKVKRRKGGKEERRKRGGEERKIKEEGFNASLVKRPVVRQA